MRRDVVALSENAGSAVRKAEGADQHLNGAGHHQRDDGQIEPAHAQRRQADDQADDSRGDAAGQ